MTQSESLLVGGNQNDFHRRENRTLNTSLDTDDHDTNVKRKRNNSTGCRSKTGAEKSRESFSSCFIFFLFWHFCHYHIEYTVKNWLFYLKKRCATWKKSLSPFELFYCCCRVSLWLEIDANQSMMNFFFLFLLLLLKQFNIVIITGKKNVEPHSTCVHQAHEYITHQQSFYANTYPYIHTYTKWRFSFFSVIKSERSITFFFFFAFLYSFCWVVKCLANLKKNPKNNNNNNRRQKCNDIGSEMPASSISESAFSDDHFSRTAI